MKSTLFTFLFLCLLSSSSFAQTELTLNIFHKLGTDNFALFQEAENNLGYKFDVKRLEYYISNITIVHDLGMETAIEDTYILVNAEETVSLALGNYDVTDVEAIRFYIGVDEPTNHLDPTSFDAEHPLAPQLPSMHWGWASGYRFIALEGSSGATTPDQSMEIHGLGDQNYYETEVELTLSASSGQLDIHLDANYVRSLEDFDISSGVFKHGFTDEAAKIIENCRDYVFSVSSGVTSTEDLLLIDRFSVYPNPAINGVSKIDLSLKEAGYYTIEINNSLGQLIQSYEVDRLDSNFDVQLDNPGLYLITLMKNDIAVDIRRLVVSQ